MRSLVQLGLCFSRVKFWSSPEALPWLAGVPTAAAVAFVRCALLHEVAFAMPKSWLVEFQGYR